MADLSSMFGTGNPWITQMGMDAFNQEQAQSKAQTAGLQGTEQRAAEMQPYNIAHTQSQTGYNNALSAEMQDKLKILQSIPLPDRIATAVAENKSKLGEAERTQADQHFAKYGQLAAAALQNGGTLPLQLQAGLEPAELKYFSGPALKNTAQMAQAYFTASPEMTKQKIKDDAEYTRATAVANIGANATLSSMDKQVAAGRFAKPWQAGLDMRIDLEHDPAKKQAMLIDAAQKAQTQPGGEEAAQSYVARAQALDNAVKLQRQAIQKPGTVDISGATQGQVPVAGGATAMPTTAPATAGPTSLPPQAAQQLKVGVKTKFKNGQVWTIENGQPKRIE